MKTIKIFAILIMSLLILSCTEQNDEILEYTNLEMQKPTSDQPPQWLTLNPCHEANLTAGFELYRDEEYTGCIWLLEPTEPYVIEIKCN